VDAVLSGISRRYGGARDPHQRTVHPSSVP
jgi:hypothetical protein